MSDIRFENEYIRDEAVVRESAATSTVFHSGRGRNLVILSLILAATLGGAGLLLESPAVAIYGGVFLIFVAVMLLASYISLRVRVKRIMRLDAGITAGREPICHVTVTSKDLIFTLIDNTRVIPLRSIQYVTVTKNLIIFVTNGRYVYPMRKDSFTTGDAIGCIAFIKAIGLEIRGIEV